MSDENRTRKRSSISLRAALACVSCLVGLSVAELVLRGVDPGDSQRTLFFSSKVWTVDGGGAVTYEPNTVIRTVAVHGEEVEYDVTFPVNNLGFVDDQDYPLPGREDGSSKRYVFVGDSFIAGYHGGSPWIPDLRERLTTSGGGPLIYNLGVGGTGLSHFPSLLESVREKIQFDEIVILAISNDLRRGYWQPVASDERTHFIHLPEKEEVAAGAYSINLRRKIEALGISYYAALHEDEWTLERFFSKNNHPNSIGYEAIADYVARCLGLE